MKTLLVVDDDELFREMMREVLAKHGFDVVLAGAARDALQLAQQQAFDAVLTDFQMPGGTDGLAFCRSLREQGGAAFETLPIWIMTGAPSVSLEQIKEAGALGLFRKPFRPAEVAAQIALALECRAQGEAVLR